MSFHDTFYKLRYENLTLHVVLSDFQNTLQSVYAARLS
jgi:hypothetical protein